MPTTVGSARVRQRRVGPGSDGCRKASSRRQVQNDRLCARARCRTVSSARKRDAELSVLHLGKPQNSRFCTRVHADRLVLQANEIHNGRFCTPVARKTVVFAFRWKHNGRFNLRARCRTIGSACGRDAERSVLHAGALQNGQAGDMQNSKLWTRVRCSAVGPAREWNAELSVLHAGEVQNGRYCTLVGEVQNSRFCTRVRFKTLGFACG